MKKISFAPLSLLFHHCTAIIFDFQTLLLFFSRILIFESSTFNFFYRYFISNNYCLQMLYYISRIITLFQGSMDLRFFIMSESFCFFQKPCCVYINFAEQLLMAITVYSLSSLCAYIVL